MKLLPLFNFLLAFRPFRNFQSVFFVNVFCLIQFRLVGQKYSSNNGTT